MRLDIPLREGTNITYQGFQHYIKERVKHLDMLERKKLLVCFVLEFGVSLFESYVSDSKGKLPDYQVQLIKNKIGNIGIVSIAKGPVFIARNLPVAEALHLFNASYCMRNFRVPLSLYAKMLNPDVMAALIVARYANRLVNNYEILLNSEKSIRAKLYFKLFMRGRTRIIDPLAIALDSCLTDYSRNRMKWYLTVDLYNYLEEDEPQIVFADAEKRQSLLLNPARNCPLKAFTVIDLDNSFVAHSADIV